MKRTALLVCLSACCLSWNMFILDALAQPSLPWPPGGGGGGGNTNSMPAIPSLPPYTAPGLKITIPVIDGTNFSLSLLEADPAGTYGIYFGTNLISGIWSNVVEGTMGQTNFSLPIPADASGYFRAARMDAPVANAGNISVFFPYEVVGTNVVAALVEGGPAMSMAITTNCAAVSNILWMPFSAVPLVTIGTNEGTYEVCFGFKGADGIEYWSAATVTLDLTPPLIVITNPVAGTTERPIIQIQGYSPERLANLDFDVVNASGALTNEPGFVVSQLFDTNQFQSTTNWFQCFDIGLTNGTNLITIRATDLAGNVTVTNLIYTLDFSGDTNPPALALIWPLAGMHISGANFTARGTLDDETAQIIAQIVSANGTTNLVEGLVERNGQFWIEELPLSDGTNDLILTAMDIAGNFTTINLPLIRSAVELVINPIAEDQLNQSAVTLSGTVSDANSEVWVNGVQAAVDGSGNWTAIDVPSLGGGTATFDAYAESANSNSPPVAQSLVVERPPFLAVVEYHDSWEEELHLWNGVVDTATFSKNWKGEITEGKGRPWELLYQGDSHYETLAYSYETRWNRQFTWSDSNSLGFYVEIVEDLPPDVQAYFIYTNAMTGAGNLFWGNSIPTDRLDLITAGHVLHYFANINYEWPYGNNERRKRVQRARTCLELRTGGKAGVNRKNLFRINVNGVRYGRPWNAAELEWFGTPVTNIPPASIQVLGKNVGNDGNLFLILPDNATLDATATAPGRHYNINVNATKHKLRMTANGIPLVSERITRNAKFCVGQKINLVSWMSPAIDEYVEEIDYEWLLQSIFVNYIENWPAEAKKYLIEWALTYQKDTHAWWVTGGDKRLGSEWDITFKNGQKAKVTGWGQMNMHRPEVVSFTNGAPYFPWITKDKATLGRPWLQLGGEYASEGGDMDFTAGVKSDFQGTIRWTQLINQYRHRDEYPTGSWTKTSGGQFWADGGEFYAPDVLSTELAPGVANQLTFADGPGNPVGISLTESHDIFKTYLRFKPTGDDSIWVTLGRVDWSWEATAINLLGYPYHNIPESWSITDTNILGPDFFDDTTFPFWLDKTTSIDIGF